MLTDIENMITETQNKSIESIDSLEEISKFIFTSKYARYLEDKQRRETWDEAVDRVLSMHLEKYSWLDKESLDKIKWAFSLVRDKRVVPSMRSMQFGGKAIFAHNARMYNCAVRHMDSLRAFSESFYLLLCGTGVSYGINEKYLSRLPDLVDETDKKGTTVTYIVEDTIEGWADSLEALLMCYFKNTPYTGRKINFDFSKIRKKGSPLKTGGGKAPGYKGLKQSLERIKEHLDYVIEYKKLKRVRSVDVYDILMHSSDAVLSGGIRRAATAVIFDESDIDMMKSKTEFTVEKRGGFIFDKDKKKYQGSVTVDGRKYEVEISQYEYKRLRKEKVIQWHRIYPWRARSNNSVRLLRGKFSKDKLHSVIENTKMWGEPGFVFVDHEDSLFNPCFEISFVPVTENGECGVQFCNLTSINGAKVTSLEEFLECSEAATIIGTLQAGYTDFPYLSNVAKRLTEDEALLGVSITGYMDNPNILLNEKNQYTASKFAVKVNKEWAAKIYIKQAARVTTTKPEGSSSLVLKSASGIHAHHAHKYFRRVQVNKQENPYKLFKKINPHMCEESVWSSTKTDDVITFPIEIPKKSFVKDDLDALKHLHIIKNTQENWVIPGTSEANKKPITHNVSCTVEVDTDEWEQVENYIFENQKFFTAISLLPKSGDKGYQQPPMERVLVEDKEKWDNLIKDFKSVDYTLLLEKEDKTELAQTAACAGGACEIDFSKEL
jgi:ribonucleoside-diphosphate reductase alpha chain